MNTDKIREAIKGIKWEGCSPGGYYDNFHIPQKAIDEIMRVITPYLSHGITEAEAREWFNDFFPPYLLTDNNRAELLNYSVQRARVLGLIVEPDQSEPVEQQPDAVIEEGTDYYEAKLLVRNRIGGDCFDIDDLEEFIDEADAHIAALEAENARLRQVPKESDALVKARAEHQAALDEAAKNTKNGVTPWKYVEAITFKQASLIFELEAHVKQLEERT